MICDTVITEWMVLQGMEVKVAIRGIAEEVNVYRHAVTQAKAECGAPNQTERVKMGVRHQPHQGVAQIGCNRFIMQHATVFFEGWMQRCDCMARA